MLRHSPIARLLWLLAIALLLVRVGEAHLHLCLDGQQQQAVAMHVEDAPTHSGAEASDGGHNDVDVDLSVAPWVKKIGVDEMPVIVFASILLALLLPITQSTSRPAQFVLPYLASVFSLRPPLRGPPR
ncbi:hypothetical protein ACFPN2_25930 [Steroidobacter flavus]|uniref:Uncharacterized protein n=1 Tax=Steroidobacter flavus TaxID=1842136 RepID=A0ABV8T1R2_9GAMM